MRTFLQLNLAHAAYLSSIVWMDRLIRPTTACQVRMSRRLRANLGANLGVVLGAMAQGTMADDDEGQHDRAANKALAEVPLRSRMACALLPPVLLKDRAGAYDTSPAW